MKQFNPFPKVWSPRGAPMGRYSDILPAAAKHLHARRQQGSDGYDRGGAYWGAPSNVWGVWCWQDGRVFCTYVRANSREDAIDKARS